MKKAASIFKIIFFLLLAGMATATWYYYKGQNNKILPQYIASGNGRIEATEYDIATKYAGRLDEVMAEEGDMVKKGQLLAKMDTYTLETQLREAKAYLVEAKDKNEYAKAMAAVRESELNFAFREKERAIKLSHFNNISQKKLDQAITDYESAKAELQAAKIQITRAASGTEAAAARIERLNAELAEMELVSPINGRILYKIAQSGEVLAGGGNVLSVLDLTDVYMTIFLPTAQAGKIFIGSESRIIFDAFPQFVIPAKVSFVAPRTQFTPKAVETRTEREKLMFRIKVKIDSTLLKKYVDVVKTGLPGEAFILMDAHAAWPENLRVALPQ